MGDAINLASRMESTAAPGTVQISEATYRLVAPLFDVWEIGDIEVKGKEGPVRAYRVLGPADRPGRLRGIRGLETALIGRDEPFARLREAVGRLQQGQGSIIFLVGEAGLGKSRLIEELRHYCLHDPAGYLQSLQWSADAAPSFGMNQPYGTLRHQMHHAYGIRETDSAEEARRKLQQFIATFPADLQATAEALFATILSLPPAAVEQESREAGEQSDGVEVGSRQSAVDSKRSTGGDDQSPISKNRPGFQLGDESFKRELFAFTLETVRRQVQQGQTIIQVLDDLHWADSASVELFQHLLQLIPHHPILNVLAMRPERNTPGWQLKSYALQAFPDCALEINLQPLTREEGGQMVDQLLPVCALPIELRETILHKADGNPFFLEEMIRTLIDNGLIVSSAEGWQLSAEANPGQAELSLPGNVQSLLGARIDRLNPNTRQTLQQAAVIGRTFETAILRRLADQPAQLEAQLSELQTLDFLRPANGDSSNGTTNGRFLFRHELTRDAAYASILHRQRRRFHRAVGEALEQVYVGRLAEQAPALAYHFEQAHEQARALLYYTLAGDTAADLYANREAADHYRRAIDLARQQLKTGEDVQAELRHLYTRRGRILEHLGRYDEALANYQALEITGQELQSSALELAAIIPQATIHATPTSHLDPDRADALSHRALALAQERGDYAAEARSHWTLMLADQQRSQYTGRSLAHGIQALEIARAHNLRKEQAYILLDLGRSYSSSGRLAQMQRSLSEAVSLWRELDNRPLLADSLATSAQGELMTGRPLEGIALAEEALQIANSIGNRWGQSFASYIIALLLEEVGRLSEAFAAFFAAERLGREGGFTGTGFFVPLKLAISFGTLGAPDYQHEVLSQLSDRMEDNDIVRLLRLLTAALREMFHGRPQQAYAISSTVYEQARPFIEPGMGGPMIATLFARMALAAGHPAAALEAVEWLLEDAQQTGNRLYLHDLLYSKGQALRALGQPSAGKAILQAAADESRRQSSHRSLWYILADLHQIALADGNKEEAARLAAEGRDVVNFLAANLTADPELRDAFLNLPSVQSFF